METLNLCQKKSISVNTILKSHSQEVNKHTASVIQCLQNLHMMLLKIKLTFTGVKIGKVLGKFKVSCNGNNQLKKENNTINNGRA